MRVAAGGVVFDSVDYPRYIYIALPACHLGPWAFPKGGVEPGEALEETAVREVREEIGVPARILGYLGKVREPRRDRGHNQVNHYFVMVRCGRVGGRDGEMEAVRRVTPAEALRILVRAGNDRDVEVLRQLAVALGL